MSKTGILLYSSDNQLKKMLIYIFLNLFFSEQESIFFIIGNAILTNKINIIVCTIYILLKHYIIQQFSLKLCILIDKIEF